MLLTAQLFTGTYHCPSGIWTTTHSNPLVPNLRSRSTTGTRKRPNPLNTNTLTPPFAKTPSVSTIDKACLETLTHPLTPSSPLTMDPLPPCTLIMTHQPDFPYNSSMSPTCSKHSTSLSHPLYLSPPSPVAPWMQWLNELARKMYIKHMLQQLNLQYLHDSTDS